jgi:sugar phosphate isomerase/epimerase
MTRLAASNIALPPFEHGALLESLRALGISGLEVAPSRVWRDTWHGLTPQQVDGYRQQISAAGLQVVGLHSLFFDHPELGLFGDRESQRHTVEFLVHLSAVCRDLGGRTLIWGGNRMRKDIPIDEAHRRCRAFLAEFLPSIASHGTKLCFEPLGPRDTDFLNTAADCMKLVEEIGSPSLGIQLDAKALAENREVDESTFARARDRLDHFHANDPGLTVIGSTGAVDHPRLGSLLGGIGYAGWISIEQRMLDTSKPLDALAASAAQVRRAYLGEQ